jgi:hypothetical protein
MRLFLSVAVLAWTSVAGAQSVGDDAAMRAGVELRRAHRDEEALAQFARVFEQTRRPVARAQMGLAEQALGRWIEAETDLRAALAATADPWITRNRDALAGALSVIEQHLGSLWIDGAGAGAEVWIDDHRVATMPLSAPIRVVAGTHSVQVRAEGFESVTRPVVATGGGEAREIVHLSRSVSAGGRVANVESGVRGLQLVSPPSSGGTQRALGWASLVGGVVGFGLGVGGALAREGSVQDYNGQANCPGRLSPSQPPDCQALVENVGTMDVLSTVGLVAGGALTITSVILLATAPSLSRQSATESRMRVVGIAGPGMVGAQCVGQF